MWRTANRLDTREPIEVTPILKTQIPTSAGLVSICDTAATQSMCESMAGCGWGANTCKPTRMRFAFKTRPAEIPDVPVTATMNIIYDVLYQVPCEGAFPMPVTPIRWIASTPGDVTSFFLPIFPGVAAGANMPAGSHGWQIESVYSPEENFQDFDLSIFGAWLSKALTGAGFATSAP
jgi:hypothetical protein